MHFWNLDFGVWNLFYLFIINIIAPVDLTLAGSLTGSIIIIRSLLFEVLQFQRSSARAKKEGADLVDHIKQQSKDDEIFHSASCKALNRKTKVEVREVI